MFTMAATAIWWILAISYPVWLALSVAAWHSEPRIGIDAVQAPDGRMIVTRVRPGAPAWDAGVRAGDVLVEINGVEANEHTWRAMGDVGREGVFLSAHGREQAAQVLARAPHPSNSLIVSLWIVSFTFAVTSFFVFSRSTRSTQVLALSLFLLAGALAIGIAPATARSQVWAQLVETPITHWAAGLFLIFFCLFQQERKSRRMISGLVLVGTVISTLGFNALWLLAFKFAPEVFEGVRQLSFTYVGAGFLGGLGFLALSYLGNSLPVTREQIRIMALGIAMAVAPLILLTALPGALGLPFVVRPEVTVIASVLVPLSFGYAIMRHRLIGIRRLVHRGTAYAFISFAVFAVYSALIVTLGVLGGQDISSSLAVQFLLLAVLFVAIPSMPGARRLAFAAVDRLLYQEYVDHAELARQVSIRAAYANHMDELTTTVLGTIARELRLSFAAFIGVSSGKASVEASVGAIPKEFTQALGSPEIAGANGHSELLSRVAVQSCAGHAVLVKLRKSAQDAWILYLGPKVTEEPFLREDLELAQSIASHVATIVEKLELLDELRSKAAELRELNRRLVQAQETERARIASHIHDEPLQQITNLIWRHAGSGLAPEAQQELQRIAEDLRNFTARLHPALLEDLGLARALEWLGSEASAASGFKVIFNYEPIERYDRLSPETQLALYRIAQEALTNCRRHANASAVWVSLCREEDQINLVVEDDGTGFQQDKGFEPGKRLGLIGMRERAEQLGGHLRIMPRSPSGTKVVASLPIDGLLSLKGVNTREVNLDDQRFDR